MAAHPETKVEMNYQQDDLYETIGLQTLLAGRNAPDVYFEWTGERLKQRQKDGYVADITEQFKTGPLKGLFDDDTLKGFTLDGKIVMVPYSADVTNVLWYNKALLAEAGVQPPTTWDDLLAACTKLRRPGVIPITTGNKDLWPAGNWFGHLASRVVGRGRLRRDPVGHRQVRHARVGDGVRLHQATADAKCVNDSANAIDDNAGAQLFFQGKAAMHPIGIWLVSWAIDEAPDLDFDYVNLPAMPAGSKGNQDSVIGVATGYIVNAKSPKQKEAAEFMALLNSEENVKALIEAEVTPLAISASEGQDIDSRSASLSSLLNNAPAVVLAAGHRLRAQDRGRVLHAPSRRCSAARPRRRTPSPRSTASSAARPAPLVRHGRRAIAAGPPSRPLTVKPARAITPWLFIAPGARPVRLRGAACRWCSPSATASRTGTGSAPMTFVGLDNYVTAATDPIFRDSFVHVCLYIAATLVPRGARRPRARRDRVRCRRPAVVPGRDLHAGDAADGRRRGPVVVRLQPRLRARERDPRRPWGSSSSSASGWATRRPRSPRSRSCRAGSTPGST